MRLATFMKISVILAAAAVTGCASIVSDSKYPVSITSSPSGAAYEIVNQSGVSVYSGVTPDQVTLRAGAGYFDGELYKVTFRKDGYASNMQTLNSGIDGWYWGNIVFGGLIGMLIVDPLTGAMYTLPERLDSRLIATPVALAPAAGKSTL
ncbi:MULTISPECIES: hypothetical protein [Pseudomonas syringae group]|uniref:PEGA domain-containing protein n=4 Tax=Pseudomonas syringae group TaxID=136849 RepID=A0AA40P0A0_9PSED|nr:MULTISPECIES: hypothetical protein [Pseudomonas syringae group]KOP57043.1 hypothetical protein OX88_07690 [Pseudomonas coronafaciens pv. porri]KOP60116.1 hypothetical protein OX90_07710 [Pseudomonas coronafaciens pv. porri]KPB49542.1 Uncharacterized protein AC511_1948 [Pseudomonas coronafaciens pv. oryzae]KPW40682.1 Uncharacterized protein ALO66_02268 [Pseudomonas coronafaciens pv. atropurpurea]KPX35101.1 Uncharacterized protein ALO77_01902 [Pseudomonas coronafaciens pv. garcae]